MNFHVGDLVRHKGREGTIEVVSPGRGSYCVVKLEGSRWIAVPLAELELLHKNGSQSGPAPVQEQ